METFCYKEMKSYEYDAGHMTKMAATPIYSKNAHNFLLRNKRADFNEICYVAFGTLAHHSLFK